MSKPFWSSLAVCSLLRRFAQPCAAFNTPEIRWYEQAGFQQVQTFRHRDDGRVFVILTRDA